MQTTALQPTALQPPQHINLFGRQIAPRRAELGYTQEEFADRLQGDAATVGSWERGARLPFIETLPQIARTCKWPLQRVVEWHLADLLVNSPYSQDLTQENFRLAAGTVFQGMGEVLCSNALGDHLRKLRESREKTQKEVAPQVKIAHTTLSTIETGRTFPKPSYLSALAGYYEEPLENLVAALLVTQGIREYGNYPLNIPLLFKKVSKQALKSGNIKTILTSNALGDYLRKLRESQEKTQKEVALQVKITRGTLSRIETGEGFPEPANLSALAEAYGKPLENLVAALLVTQGIREYGNYPLNIPLLFKKVSKQALKSGNIKTILTSNALGATLKKLRENHEKTQDEAAFQVKIARGTLSAIETGATFPEPANLSALAQVYDKPLPQLAGLCLATQAVVNYGILSEINLQAAWDTALSLAPQSLSCGLKRIEPLLEGKPQFFLAKISNLLQEQGISLEDRSKIKEIAQSAKIPFKSFWEFVQGKRSLGDFLYSSSGDGEVIQDLAQALKYDPSNLVGYLGIDLAYAEEIREGRTPSYVSSKKVGVDLESVDLDGKRRRIEVKALSTINPALAFTEKEWEAATNHSDEGYYLLVILNAATEEPTFFSLEGPLDYLEAREYGSNYYVSIKDIFSLARAQGHCLEPFPVGKIEISRPVSG